MLNYILWLDDLRDPSDYKEFIERIIKQPTDEYDIVWVTTYDKFVSFINDFGLPYAVFFDNDLGDTKTNKEGYDCCKWLVEYCMDNHFKLPIYGIQSMNTVAANNIANYLRNAEKML